MKWLTRLFVRRRPVVSAWGDISQEYAREYMQVAALLARDIDLLADIADQPSTTLESLRAQVKHLVKMKDEATTDAEKRERRYVAAALLFNLSSLEAK